MQTTAKNWTARPSLPVLPAGYVHRRGGIFAVPAPGELYLSVDGSKVHRHNRCMRINMDIDGGRRWIVSEVAPAANTGAVS